MGKPPGEYRGNFMLFAYFVYIAHLITFTRGSSLLVESLFSWIKNISQNRRGVFGQRKREKKKQAQKREKLNGTILAGKKNNPSTPLRADIQIASKEVPIKSKFVVHKVKNEVSLL